MKQPTPPPTPDELNRASEGRLSGLLGMQVQNVAPGLVEATMELRAHHLAPNGYLHAATVIALADTCCGYGASVSRPDGATGFTTIELKANFLGTTLEGTIACSARLVHGGRTTQVWDADVRDVASGRTIALFRCTQLLLYPSQR